uniref:Uncharacterized protein n=1 Tax=Anguilla anguilla TaxID=7936 RepID=A0A0E9P7D4_ANGAN
MALQSHPISVPHVWTSPTHLHCKYIPPQDLPVLWVQCVVGCKCLPAF